MNLMVKNWADELVNGKVVDFYYDNIKDWYTPKKSNNIFVYQKEEGFYLLKEPYEEEE